MTLRLKEETRRKVARIARRKRVTPSQVMRDAIEALVEQAEPAATPYESMADLIGVVDGGDPRRSAGMGRRFGELLRRRRRPR